MPASLPKSLAKPFKPYVIDEPGQWGIIGDIHLPCHDETTIRLFVQECKRRKVTGVILNGDILDCHELSDHLKDPSAPRYIDEIELAKEMLTWMTEQLPKARFVFRNGNHEDRLYRYLACRAPAIEGLEGVNLKSWLHLDDLGIDHVGNKRIIHVGKLHLLHGHEVRGQGGVNPARWLYLKARSVAACNHFHRTSEHHARNIGMKYEAAWSIGAACDLHPEWLPVNEWNLGAAWVELSRDGSFSFENRRVFEGKLV